MKEIVVISGKGGTGKTSLTASFAIIGGQNLVVADCDVDAADMHLLMDPDFSRKEDFYSGELAILDQGRCNQCGTCADVCRFKAIAFKDDQYTIDPISCEGCGYCSHVCPTEAITMQEQKVGEWYISSTKIDSRMVHARLGIGAENSGKLVTQVKNAARHLAEKTGKEYILVDGSPGIGCPVVSSLSGAHLVVLVTEPTVSGLHDLKRVYQLVKKFQIPAGCIINKHDLNPEMSQSISEYLESENITLISVLPYDENFTRAMINGQTIVEQGNGKLPAILTESWKKILELTQNESEQS